jgi:ribosomal protein S18 acetylase RimI-like enzyme
MPSARDAGVVIARLPVQRLDELELLWGALFEHQKSITAHLDDRARTLSDSWRDRRALERGWLANEPDSFVLAAERDGVLVGYAFVRVVAGAVAVSWSVSDPHAELVTLSVLPELRNGGLGGLLMDGVERELERLGISDIAIDVITTNVDAQRFYERRGAAPFLTTFLQRVGKQARQNLAQ